MKLSHRASITVTVGTLLISGIFLVASVYYGYVAGTFFTDRTLPAAMFLTDLEATVSGVYSLSGDVDVEYSGTSQCRWDGEEREFLCASGASIYQPSVGISYTSDPAIMGFSQSHCVFINIIDAARKILKNAKFKGSEIRKIKKAISKLEQEGKEGAKKALERKLKEIQGVSVFGRTQKNIAQIKESLTRELAKMIADPIANAATHEAYDASVEGLRVIFTRYLGVEGLEELGSEEAIRLFVNKALKGDTTSRTSLSVWTITAREAGEEISEKALKDAEDWLLAYVKRTKAWYEWFSVNKLEAEAQEAFERFVWKDVVVDVPKEQVWKQIKTDFIGLSVAMPSCFIDCSIPVVGELLTLMSLWFNGLVVIRYSQTDIDHFYDFYVGKVGHLHLDYNLDGIDQDIDRLFVVNGADMCYLRNQLTYNWTERFNPVTKETEIRNYEPTPLSVEDGSIAISKRKTMFDTMCEEDNEYYSDGLIEIAQKALEVCKTGSIETFDVIFSPARAIFKEDVDGKTVLCEKRISRTPDGRYNGSFTLFCYDFEDFPDNCNVDLDGVFKYMMVDYTVCEDETTGNEEKANSYFAKHPSEIRAQLRIEPNIPNYEDAIPAFIKPVTDTVAQVVDGAISGLSTAVVYGMENARRVTKPTKDAFIQSRYDAYTFTINKVGNELRMSSNYKEPVVYMDWDSIYTDEHPKEVLGAPKDWSNVERDITQYMEYLDGTRAEPPEKCDTIWDLLSPATSYTMNGA